MTGGYSGKIAFIDLASSEIEYVPTEVYADKFLGGRSVASQIYRERVGPDVGAFDAENVLVFMTGPMVATGIQGASRLSVVGKSPMTCPEGFCYGNIGGFAAAELKRAGLDGVVISGRSKEPVYLWVSGGTAELKSAGVIWGLNVYTVEEKLKEIHGKDIRYITTGVAGENRVRTAVVAATGDCTATGGFGAVMGDKFIKAIAIKGSKKIPVADAAALKELNSYTIRLGKHYPNFTVSQKSETGIERVGRSGCYQCGIGCHLRNRYRLPDGREGVRKCQSRDVYRPASYGLTDEPIDTYFDAPVMCNDYSICTIELAGILRWLKACYSQGILTEEETGLPLSKMGSREFLGKLLHDISYRQGFGNVLAEGLYRVRDVVSDEARAKTSKTLAAVGMGGAGTPQAYVVNSIVNMIEPRSHRPLHHYMDFILERWLVHERAPEQSKLDSEVFKSIAKQFWGGEQAADLYNYDGKALAAVLTQNSTYLKDALGLCDFCWPIMDSVNTADQVGDPDLIGRIFTAVTGISGSELEIYTERLFNLQRAILVREGSKLPEVPPDYLFTDPLMRDARGRQVLVPGPGGEGMVIQGVTLDRDKFKQMMREYYRLRGYDPETGVPYAGTLGKLGIDDLVSDYEGAGYKIKQESNA